MIISFLRSISAKMSAVPYIFLVLVSMATVCSTLQISCSMACDILRADDASTSLMYQVNVNHIEYQPGSSVKVTMSGHNATYPFVAVVIQAKGMGNLDAVGVMMAQNIAQLSDCNADGAPDTVCMTSSENSLGTVEIMWQPPNKAGIHRFVEFQAVFEDPDGGLHHQHSVLLTENVTVEEKPEKPEVDLHNDKTEMELVIIQKEKDQKMIDLENLASEDDLGVREREEEEEHQRELHWEETQYEQALKEEEDLLRARIQAELKDKEEYDRLKYEREQREREEREREEREREEREREEREQRERKEREREERERNNNTKDKGPDEEVDLNEDKDGGKDKPTAGTSRLTVTSGAVMLLSALVLGL